MCRKYQITKIRPDRPIWSKRLTELSIWVRFPEVEKGAKTQKYVFHKASKVRKAPILRTATRAPRGAFSPLCVFMVLRVTRTYYTYYSYVTYVTS